MTKLKRRVVTTQHILNGTWSPSTALAAANPSNEDGPLDSPEKQKLKGQYSHTWRGQLFGSLVRTKLIFGAAQSRSASSGIELLFRLVNEKSVCNLSSGEPDRFFNTSPFPAVVHIKKALTGKDWQLYQSTSPKLSERFFIYESKIAGMSTRRDHTWKLAILCLHHPRKPDPEPLLAALRSNLKTRDVTGSKHPSTGAAVHVSAVLRRLMKLLHDRGRTKERQWADETYREQLYGVRHLDQKKP